MKPECVVDAGPAVPDALEVHASKARPHVGDVRERAHVQQAVVGERVRDPHPQRIRIQLTAVDDLGQRHLADLHEGVGPVWRALVGRRRIDLAGVVEPLVGRSRLWNDASIEKMTSPS